MDQTDINEEMSDEDFIRNQVLHDAMNLGQKTSFEKKAKINIVVDVSNDNGQHCVKLLISTLEKLVKTNLLDIRYNISVVHKDVQD